MRRRAKRGTLHSEKGDDGKLYVWVHDDHPTVKDDGEEQHDRDERFRLAAVKSPGSGVLLVNMPMVSFVGPSIVGPSRERVPPGVLRRTLRPGLGLHPYTTQA